MSGVAHSPGVAEFEEFNSAFEAAAGAVGSVVTSVLEIAGRGVALEFAGPALAARMTAPFAHLLASIEPEIRFRCWDTETTGVQLPASLDPLALHLKSLPAMQREGPTRWANGRPDPGVTGYNRERSTGVYWFRSSSGLTFGDLAGGLRSAITWAMADRQMSFLHTAGVGHEGKAALIVGASGSGKSSTALTCLLEGMDFLGDDHCLLTRGPHPDVHAVYGAAKLHTAQMRRFPELEPFVCNPNRDPWDKAVALLHPAFASSLPKQLPVACLLVPRIGEAVTTTVEPLARGAALLALAPSTLLQMTGVDREGLGPMGELVRSVPCFRLTVGSSRKSIAEEIRTLLERVGTS